MLKELTNKEKVLRQSIAGLKHTINEKALLDEVTKIRRVLYTDLATISRETNPRKREQLVILLRSKLKNVNEIIGEGQDPNLTIWEKVKVLYHKLISMIEKGLQYLLLALLTLSFIIVIMLVMTNGEFHKFLYGISDIFFRTIKFLKNMIFAVIEGAFSLDAKIFFDRVKKTYDKYVTQIKDILSMMERAGIDKRSIPVVLGCITASLIVAKSIAKEYIK